MSAEDVLSAAWTLNPRTVERARRLAAAVALLRDGMSQEESRGLLLRRYPIDKQEAHRLVAMASDMAGKP